MNKKIFYTTLAFTLITSATLRQQCNGSEYIVQELEDTLLEHWHNSPEDICKLVSEVGNTSESALKKFLDGNLKITDSEEMPPGSFRLRPRKTEHYYGGSTILSGGLDLYVEPGIYASLEDGVLWNSQNSRLLTLAEIKEIAKIKSKAYKNLSYVFIVHNATLVLEQKILINFLGELMEYGGIAPKGVPGKNKFYSGKESGEILLPVHRCKKIHYISIIPKNSLEFFPDKDHMTPLPKNISKLVSKIASTIKVPGFSYAWQKSVGAARRKRPTN
ncbi:hypothetical protein ACFLY6_03225 [Candidatus Dependentiae bacterium]